MNLREIWRQQWARNHWESNLWGVQNEGWVVEQGDHRNSKMLKNSGSSLTLHQWRWSISRWMVIWQLLKNPHQPNVCRLKQVEAISKQRFLLMTGHTLAWKTQTLTQILIPYTLSQSYTGMVLMKAYLYVWTVHSKSQAKFKCKFWGNWCSQTQSSSLNKLEVILILITSFYTFDCVVVMWQKMEKFEQYEMHCV